MVELMMIILIQLFSLLKVSLVLVFMVGVIVYKLLVYRPLAKNPSTKAKAQQIANMTGAMVNLMTIMILSRVRTIMLPLAQPFDPSIQNLCI